MPQDPRDRDDVEARLRRALSEHADQAPPSGLVEQRILAAARRGDTRSRRPRWLSVTSLRPVAVAASVLVVVGATIGGAALVNGLDRDSHAGATSTATSSAPVSTTRPSPTTSTTAAVSSPPPVTGTSETGASATPSEPTTGKVPTGFTISDLTFVGTKDGWALGTAPTCANKPCTSLVRTTDGGQNWVGLSPPVVGLVGVDDCTTSACVSGVRFASTRIGYLFGPRITYLTTNGGASWNPIPGGAEALEIGDGNVLRVTTSKPGCTKSCVYIVQLSAVGSSTWHTVTTATLPGVPVDATLVRSGTKAFVQVYGHTADAKLAAISALFVSTDGGNTWTARNDACQQQPGAKGVVYTNGLTAARGAPLTVLCQPEVASDPAYLASSTDDGATFTATPTYTLGPPIAAAAPGVLLAQGPDGTSRAGQLLRSADGGRTWSTVARRGPITGPDFAGFLGFENPSTGRWVPAGDPSTVWTTTDAGAHWTKHTFK